MTDATTPAPGDAGQTEPAGFLQRLKRHIIHPELTPEQIAWSFAIGLAVAFNPLLGLHMAMVLLFCAIFRGLHRPLMFLASFINNPWTMVPIATGSAYLGNLVLRHSRHLDLSSIHWKEIGWRSFLTWHGFEGMHEMLRPVLRSYLYGGLILSLLALPVGYWTMLLVARRMRRFHFHHHPHGDSHGHAVPHEAGAGDAGQAGGSPGEPSR